MDPVCLAMSSRWLVVVSTEDGEDMGHRTLSLLRNDSAKLS